MAKIPAQEARAGSFLRRAAQTAANNSHDAPANGTAGNFQPPNQQNRVVARTGNPDAPDT